MMDLGHVAGRLDLDLREIERHDGENSENALKWILSIAPTEGLAKRLMRELKARLAGQRAEPAAREKAEGLRVPLRAEGRAVKDGAHGGSGEDPPHAGRSRRSTCLGGVGRGPRSAGPGAGGRSAPSWSSRCRGASPSSHAVRGRSA